MLQQILNYWNQMEFFNPCWPVNIYEDIDLTKKDLPWDRSQNDPRIRISYDVYLGKAKSKDFIEWMLDVLCLQDEEFSIENDNSLVCLCALKIDENGHYVANSFTISSFVWAICRLIHASSFGVKLDVVELDQLQQQMNCGLLHEDEDDVIPVVSKNYLDEIYEMVCNKIKVKQDLLTPAFWCRKKIQYANKEGVFPPLNPSTELLQSFYLKDMDKIQKSPTKRIERYVQAMITPISKVHQVQIDVDVAHMQKWLKADMFPLGVWPSRNSPGLMQQLGINIATASEQSVFSVNGPPGTGKTTLLKEIVVANVIQRAIVMTGYDVPDSAFVKNAIQNPPDQYNQSFYQLDKKLSAYGVIVASNNNAAVENISVELPKAIFQDRTNRFSGAGEKTEDTYFSDIATKLLGEPAWGLISAKLGKKSNQKALRERLWWAEDEVTLKRYYKGNLPDWNMARQNFQTALKAVTDTQKNIAQAQILLVQQEKVTTSYLAACSEHDETQAELCRQKEKLQIEEQEKNRLKAKQLSQQQNIDTLLANLSFVKRIFWWLFQNNSIIKEWKKIEKDKLDTAIQITRQEAARQMQEEAVHKAEIQYRESQHNKHLAKQKLDAVHKEISPYQTLFGGNWADATFWLNISENERSQTACPWTYAEYDKLREDLFYQALMLHKAFVLSSKCVKQNLMRLFTMWDDKFMRNDCEAAYGDLLNTLLLIIPVVSTTFASVQSFLDGVQAEELGVLIVDESGQATPQSALGALWRTQKAIVVGDPLQVEPIVTIPTELRKRFADENNIPPIYRLPELSVQMLADQLNPYGGIRSMDGEELWLGCPLVVHRRCLNPMFQISNEVAYNNRMFLQTAQPNPTKKYLLQQSVWFDVKGIEIGNKNHTVPQQIHFVIKLFEQAMEVYENLPDLYIITPFTSVDRALKDALRPIIKKKLPHMEPQDITEWLKENCGTIHTFQGKEASEVLLVLGCDAQSGRGAAQWVGQKPNIINVAVSRAKYRFGVVGDYNLWKTIQNVGTICKYLTLSEEDKL